MDWYGVKLVYRYEIQGEGRPFYEESVMLVRADSFDEAYRRAEARTAAECGCYENSRGRTVRQAVHDWIDCFLIGESLEEGAELYSSFFTVADVAELEGRYRSCTVDELRPLRQR